MTSTALIPLTEPFVAYVYIGNALMLSPLALGLKLCAILGGSLLTAAAIRRLVGAPAIKQHKEPIDGFNILILFVFVAAVMGTGDRQLFRRTRARPSSLRYYASRSFSRCSARRR